METIHNLYGRSEQSLEAGYINKEDILNYINEEDIFSLVFGFVPEEHQYVCSPFREDHNPNCWFEYAPDGRLRFVDFANPNIIGGIKMCNIDCFSAVKIYFKLPNFYQVLEFIQDNLIKGKTIERKPAEKQKIELIHKDGSKILFKSRAFNEYDKRFWSRYGITRQQLVDDHVFAVETFKVINSDGTITSTPYDITYCYTDFENSHKKIYRPYNKKRFITSCTKNDVGNIKNMIPYERLYITKSYKDCRVLRNLGLSSIWFQNEGMIPEDKILIPILKRAGDIIVFFDNDKTGLQAGNLVNIKIQNVAKNSQNIFLPTSLLEKGIKDPSDFIKAKGINEFIEFLKSKQLW